MDYLRNHQILESQNLDELRELLLGASAIENVDIIKGQPDIDAKVGMADIAGLPFVDVSYGDTEINIKSSDSPSSDLMLAIPYKGLGKGRRRGEEFEYSPDVGFMRNMEESLDVTQKNFSAFALRFSAEKLKNHLSALTGSTISGKDIKFDLQIDFTAPESRYLRNYIKHVAAELNGPLLGIDNPIILETIRDSLLTNILICLPHSYSDLIKNKHSDGALPYYLKRARDFIHENAHTTITPQKLAKHAGCSYRTLQFAFKNTFNASPMEYLKSVRLQHIHEQLLLSTNNINVRDIALQWGFTHMGNLARDYKNKFGNLPSETLMRRT